ncbi:MAG: hypothetical protein ACOCXA_09225, partial [Planctomycetota bacterium]
MPGERGAAHPTSGFPGGGRTGNHQRTGSNAGMNPIPVCLLSIIATVLPAAQVQPLVGPMLQGEALRIDHAATVEIGDHQLPLRRCDWLSLTDDADWQRPELARVAEAVVLRSGSFLPVESIVGVTAGDGLAVVGPFGVMQLPLSAVQAWGRRGAVLEGPEGDDDADLVELINGQQVAGQVLSAEPERLRLRTDLDEQPLGIAWERITAVHLQNAPVEQPGLHLVCRHDPHLPALLLTPRLPLALIDVPAALIDPHMRLSRLQVRGGDAVPLSSIDPVQVEQQGAFDVVWPYARDSLIGGGP